MTRGCVDLLKAIDAYIAKKEEDLSATLFEAGFANASDTVNEIASLEDQLTKALIEETEYLLDAAERAGDLTTFASLWEDIKRDDKVSQTIREILSVQFTILIPTLTVSYLTETDPELAQDSITKASASPQNESVTARIRKRTTAWIEEWSEELGEMMELGSHKEIEKILMDGLKKGDGIAEFARAIQESGIREEYYRARRVALTETLRAHSVAQQEAFTQNPAVEEKEWRHTGSYRNSPRENHVWMDGQHVPVNEPFTLEGVDGGIYYPMHPRDSSLPPGESVNCHCICQPRVNQDVLGLSIEERRALQAQIIAEDDGAWEKELDAKNRARAGIEPPTSGKNDSGAVYNHSQMRYNSAVVAEPKITTAITGVAEKSGAKIEGLEYRLKSPESYARKVALNPSAEIRDVIRYTYTAPAHEYTKMVERSMKELVEQGYQTTVVKNYWLKSDNPYNGVNTFVKTPAGQMFELQYHTPESFALKNGKLHELYEKQRVLTDRFSSEFIQLQEEMANLSSDLEVPDGIEEVLSYGK